MESSRISFYNFPSTASFTDNSSFSFPESDGDALLIEVQDKKKSVQGKAMISMTSLTDNPVNTTLVFLPNLNLFHFASDNMLIKCTDESSTFFQNDNVRWWPIYHGEQECVGKIQLFLGSTTTSDEDYHIKVCSFSNKSQIICFIL